LPLDRFIAERGELAKQLRRDGDREGATAVASLRKPSIGAWAVNQLVRTQRRDVKALFDAGDRLQKAQAQLLAGRADGQAVREAVERERTAVERLVEAARGLLNADGHELTPATLERVSETLHAAALDEQARSQVEDGCLQRELRHIGLGAGGELAEPRSDTAPKKRDDRGAAKGQADARKAQAAARKAEADTRRAAERAERELDRAQARRDEAAAALADAEQALADNRSRADGAAREHERAQQALDQLQN
jgi:hypothetical protein